MGSSVYSSFLLPSLLSGRMTLKTMVVLCLALVAFIEANPVPEDDGWEDDDVDGRNKWDPDLETEKLIDLLDTKSNESEGTTDDSEQMDVMVPVQRKKRDVVGPGGCSWDEETWNWN